MWMMPLHLQVNQKCDYDMMTMLCYDNAMFGGPYEWTML